MSTLLLQQRLLYSLRWYEEKAISCDIEKTNLTDFHQNAIQNRQRITK